MRRRGCTICSSPTLPTWSCAIRARTHWSKTETKVTASMPNPGAQKLERQAHSDFQGQRNALRKHARPEPVTIDSLRRSRSVSGTPRTVKDPEGSSRLHRTTSTECFFAFQVKPVSLAKKPPGFRVVVRLGGGRHSARIVINPSRNQVRQDKLHFHKPCRYRQITIVA